MKKPEPPKGGVAQNVKIALAVVALLVGCWLIYGALPGGGREPGVAPLPPDKSEAVAPPAKPAAPSKPMTPAEQQRETIPGLVPGIPKG